MQELFLFVICICATTLGAISGIGGGVIIKPVMDAVSGMSVSTISFLSGCTVLSMSVVSLLRSRGDDVKIVPKQGTCLALGGAVGGLVGKWIFDMVKSAFANDGLIGTVQSVLMVILTVGVLIYVLNKQRIHTLRVTNAFACVVIGLALGILSSFLGIGGGPINLAVLYFFFSMDTKTAALNSLYIILFSQTTSLFSTIVQNRVPEFPIAAMLAMVLGGILGGFCGRSINKRMNAEHVDRLFRWMLIGIILISCHNVTCYIGEL